MLARKCLLPLIPVRPNELRQTGRDLGATEGKSRGAELFAKSKH
jgi:hypothetical protein